MKKLISTRIHGIIDYATATLLIISPWLFGFAGTSQAATVVPVILGFSILGYSLCTNYELGIKPLVSMHTHLRLDIIGGVLLAISPWLFRFNELVYFPHLVIGLMEIGVVLMTKTQPQGGIQRQFEKFHQSKVAV
jgi:hypothetical protein